MTENSQKLWRCVITDMIDNGLDEASIEAKYRLPAGTITEWLETYEFTKLLGRRINTAVWRSRIVTARNAVAAANALAALTASQKEETRRKASLAIMARHKQLLV